MSRDRAVEVLPITDSDVPAVAEFLESGMTAGVSASSWRAAMRPTWADEQPNHGFMLHADGGIVGAYLAFYSHRQIGGAEQRICNLGAWYVVEEHRASGLRLLRRALRQRDYVFTDLSPSGNVVPLNERLGFTRLDTSTALVANIPWPVINRKVRVLTSQTDIERTLSGRDLQIYRDHAGSAAARHVVLDRGDEHCYVVYRRDRRKRLPLFASVLHVSDRDLFREASLPFYRHLLLRRGVPFTLAESRVVDSRPRWSVTVAGRPKMYLGDNVDPSDIDYLYSELTNVAW